MSLISEPVVNLGALFEISFLLKLALIVVILSNFKCLPLVWHIRLLRGFRFVLRSNRYKKEPGPAQLFQPLIISSGGSLMEMDYNLHKSNSTYFADLDVARCHLMCTLFNRGVDYARNTKSLDFLGSSDGMVGLALGAVSCTFRREVKPCQRYEIWSRVLTWDQKWMYIVTHFVRKDAIKPRSFTLLPGQVRRRQGKLKDLAKKEDAIFASSLSKCVWKKGRRTIPPELMLQASGLLPPRADQEDFFASLREEPLSKLKLSRQAEEVYDIPFKIAEKIETTWDALTDYFSPESDDSEGGFSAGPKEMRKQAEDEWTWDRVERERQRGMEIAKSLAELDRLDGEFTAEADALGLRRDLW
ncbi:hypothetical protein DTO207G8_9012 [Paecilomyces variotii]|nr:hypothetical protein DTO169E5_6752 [Paecilomyces variotii]KAJ9246387.1 hypothetical protein DTO207G8_9012 [Paecilomyces variotii]KAJ9387110.1 hypothetical protein DTO063F5_3205 [Paecilomyces variotii]